MAGVVRCILYNSSGPLHLRSLHQPAANFNGVWYGCQYEWPRATELSCCDKQSCCVVRFF